MKKLIPYPLALTTYPLNVMRNILVVALGLICLTCAGCFQANFDLKVTSDGAVVRNWKLLGTAPFLRQIEDMKAMNEKVFPNIRVTPISEDDMLGYEFKLDYPDIESFAKSWSEIYSAHAGENKGVSRQNGWFFDAYEFDFYFMSTPANIPPEAEYFNQAAFDSVIYAATIQLPYSADSHDADEISADGKLLKWNLAPIAIHGGEKNLNVRFKIWHKDKLALTAAIELLLLVATIFFFRKARAEGSESLNKDLRFKRNVFIGLSVALAIISVYMLLAPVTFTDADIISPIPSP